MSWEFFKYIDGLVDPIYWHRGRCLSYGDGVSYWALADMVRMRAGISEEEASASIAERLHACVADLIADDEERRYVEPRLAQLLGIETRGSWSREDLFAGWRLFFERLADRGPVVLVFEDVQWADEALLDFVAHLLERGRDKPLFVITLARPELGDRRPGWGSARAATSLFLEPLSDADMDELLTGMVPGLPAELQSRIRARAEGVPLYAIETVRMLLDRGLVEQVGNRFEPLGRIDELDVPDSLQSLVAARMDGLPPEERTLLQDAAVLGKTFTIDALEALAGRPGSQLADPLASLVAREFLGVQADPRSPDHGQYGFLQSLMQKVAYETLSKRDRKAKHLAMAEHLETAWAGDPDEIVEVIASHRLQAYELAPDAGDAAEIRERASGALAAAGRRAESVAAKTQALGYYRRAAELADDLVTRAALSESAGEMATDAGRFDEAMRAFDEAIVGFQEAGLSHAAARVHARTGMSLWYAGHLEDANARMEGAFSALEQDEPDHDVAMLAAQIGRLQFFAGRSGDGLEMLDRAIAIAEDLGLPDVLADAFITKGLIAEAQRRGAEALVFVKGGLDVALEHDVPTSALRGATNMSYLMMGLDRLDDAIPYQEMGIELARRLGIASGEWFLLIHRVAVWQLRGEWDRVVDFVRDLPDPTEEPGVLGGAESIVGQSLPVFIERGAISEARALADRWITASEENADYQIRTQAQWVRAVLASGEGHPDLALMLAEAISQEADKLAIRHPTLRRAWICGVNAALELGDLESAERLMKLFEGSPPGQLSPMLLGSIDRYRARLLAAAGVSDGVDERYGSAVRAFVDVGMPFEEATARLDRARWLAVQARVEDALTEAARAKEIFERLGALPWIERASAIG
jgi:tetratricopeptide (TPR) repeat protein